MQFYFDYISPNAYLAWTQIPQLVAGRNIEVEPVPVLFSGLLSVHGQRGPAEIPAKMQWMVRNILRKAKQLNVPINPPVSHPFNPLLALRVSSLSIPDDKRKALITAIFEAVWVRRIDVSDPSALAEILNETGLEGPGLIKQAGSSEIKELLRERTAAAASAGVFGVPTMLVGKSLFWGLDDFTYLEAFLNNLDPLHEEDIEAWSKVRPSAWRRNVS
jgi:2-hydroxychromene-2-carboxylate isomerase